MPTITLHKPDPDPMADFSLARTSPLRKLFPTRQLSNQEEIPEDVLISTQPIKGIPYPQQETLPHVKSNKNKNKKIVHPDFIPPLPAYTKQNPNKIVPPSVNPPQQLSLQQPNDLSNLRPFYKRSPAQQMGMLQDGVMDGFLDPHATGVSSKKHVSDFVRKLSPKLKVSLLGKLLPKTMDIALSENTKEQKAPIIITSSNANIQINPSSSSLPPVPAIFEIDTDTNQVEQTNLYE